MRVERSEREAHEQVARPQLRIAIGREYRPALSPEARLGVVVGALVCGDGYVSPAAP